MTYRVRSGGTAKCTLHGATLRAAKAGTCLVTATKGAKGVTPLVTSPPTTITFTKPSSRSPALSSVVHFSASSATLNAAAKSVIDAFAKKVKGGVTVVITGYSHSNRKLAKLRATVVATYLTSRVRVVTSIKAVTDTSLHEVSLSRK